MADRVHRTAAERSAGISNAISMLDQITPLILTHDELPNIERTLAKLTWATRIVVIDSGSTDGTLDILRRDPRITVFVHEFVDFAEQCNFGLAYIESPWVLSLDADYELSNELLDEMHNLIPSDAIAGYSVRFVYRVHGHPLHGTLYPPRTVLHRKDRAFYRQEGHAHKIYVAGAVRPLRGVIYHDDRKPLSRWLSTQLRYAAKEAEYLLAKGGYGEPELSRADRIRLMGWLAPFAILLHVLFVRRCVLDGWPGWHYTLQRLLAETLLALEILDRRCRRDREPVGAGASGSGRRRRNGDPGDADPVRMAGGTGDR
jgi:glycosyltransferase involved in cell wall biosynthesis